MLNTHNFWQKNENGSTFVNEIISEHCLILQYGTSTNSNFKKKWKQNHNTIRYGTVPYRSIVNHYFDNKVFISLFLFCTYIISYNFFHGINLIRYILLTYVYQYHLILQVDKVIHQTSNISILFKYGGYSRVPIPLEGR